MILVEGLRKSFADVRAVDGVDITVEQGEILVLLGQNGAGKSTTLRCLGGILRPDAGTISLDGLRLPEKLNEVRSRLGVVPDQARLYGRNTAPEYLDHFGFLYGVPADVRKKRIAALLERFELADRADTVLAAYSRGMAQKVSLIRATLHEPDWIFCDEPTAALDPVAAPDTRRYLGEQGEASSRPRCSASSHRTARPSTSSKKNRSASNRSTWQRWQVRTSSSPPCGEVRRGRRNPHLPQSPASPRARCSARSASRVGCL